MDRLEAGDRLDDADHASDALVIPIRERNSLGARPADPGAAVSCPLRRERVAELPRSVGCHGRTPGAGGCGWAGHGRLVGEPAAQVAVGIDAPIAEERPVRAA